MSNSYVRRHVFDKTNLNQSICSTFREVHSRILNRPEIAPKWNYSVDPELEKVAFTVHLKPTKFAVFGSVGK